MSKRHFPLTLRHLLLRVLKVFSKTENKVSTVRKIAHPYYGKISQIDRLSFLFCSKHGEDALVTVTFLQFIPLNFHESWYLFPWFQKMEYFLIRSGYFSTTHLTES